jgi:hypothetical protein
MLAGIVIFLAALSEIFGSLSDPRLPLLVLFDDRFFYGVNLLHLTLKQKSIGLIGFLKVILDLL